MSHVSDSPRGFVSEATHDIPRAARIAEISGVGAAMLSSVNQNRVSEEKTRKRGQADEGLRMHL